jgi:hypothetical protein
LNKSTLGERDISYVYTHTLALAFLGVLTRDLRHEMCDCGIAWQEVMVCFATLNPSKFETIAI